jgi:hypothetical protein
MTDREARSLVGTSLQYVAIVNISLNLGVVFLSMVLKFITKCKLRWLRWKRRREIKKQLEEKQLRTEIRAIKLKIKLKGDQVIRRALRAETAAAEFEKERIAQEEFLDLLKDFSIANVTL